MTRKLLAMSLALLMIAGAGCGSSSQTESEGYVQSLTNVTFYQIEPQRFVDTISLPVVVQPAHAVELGLTNGGRIVSIEADKGDRIRTGQLLLQADDTILKAAYESAMASFEFQTGEFERSTDLFENGSISSAEHDAAKLALAGAKASYEMAMKQYEDATLEAPFDGVITMRNAEIGAIASPGTPLFRIIDASRVKIQTGIPEPYIGDFQEGTSVDITFDAYPGMTYQATVNYVSPEADPSVRTFLAEMEINNADGSLKTGIMGNATIVRRIYPEAIMIPINAIIETQNGRIVFVLNEDNTVEQRTITVLNNGDILARVTGVSAGEKLVTQGQYDLINGESVNVTGTYVTGEREGS